MGGIVDLVLGKPDDEREAQGATMLQIVLLTGTAVALGVLIVLALADLWGRTS